LAATFVADGPLIVYADDRAAASQDAYKVSSVKSDGKIIEVKEADPYRNVKPPPPSDGKYHPADMNFGATSPMASKKFDVPSDGLAKADPDFNNGGQNTFANKPYAFDSSNAPLPNLDAKGNYPATSAYSRNAAEFDKSYMTASADAGQDRAATLGNATSTEQGRTAVLGDRTTATYADTFADKKFQGPEADAAHHHLTKLANGQMLVTDLPNRPLTIDEVRDLINHGFKPNTDVAPPEPSKPLNDPGYKPQPLREMPPADPSAPGGEDDKNDPVPPPGTMAAPTAPENSEPLPQP